MSNLNLNLNVTPVVITRSAVICAAAWLCFGHYRMAKRGGVGSAGESAL